MEESAIQYVTSDDGLSLAYSVTGKGPPLVYMGLSINSFLLRWKYRPKLLADFGGRFTLAQYDCRGQGLSSRDVPPSRVDDYVADLKNVADRLNFSRLAIVASGFDVHVAVNFAVSYPERARALILSGVNPRSGASFTTNLRQLATNDWDTFLSVAAQTLGSTLESVPHLEDFRQSVSQKDWLNRQSAFDESDITGLLPQVSCPTLVVAPVGGPIDWIPEARRVAALIPRGRLAIPSAEDFQSSYASLIEDFLTDCDYLAPSEPLLEHHVSQSTNALSGREIEVLRLIAAGRTNQQLADDLVISLNTVRRHVSNIFAKIGAANRADAVSYAHRHGLIDLS